MAFFAQMSVNVSGLREPKPLLSSIPTYIQEVCDEDA
jgi:hypothetical protein